MARDPRLTLAVLVAGFGLSACAAVEPEPCTADWFKFQGRAAFSEVRTELADVIRDLKTVARDLDRPEITPFAAVRLIGALPKLQRLFEAYQMSVEPRLQRIATECQRPEEVRKALVTFLEDEGLEDVATTFEGFAALLGP
jgi:hypothetical protein